jgi:capsid assembly protease
MDSFRAALAQAAADKSVEAIVLDVDSPGGTVAGAAETAAAVASAASIKPVTAVANTLMASAAYWIGSQATNIVMAPSGEAGSIGVLALHENRSAMLERMGVEITIQHAGRYKAEGNPFQPLDDAARAARQNRIDAAYDTFTSAVASGRGRTVEAISGGFGEGRVMDAGPAVAAGLADRIATLDEVIAEYAGRRSGSPNRRPRRSALPFL